MTKPSVLSESDLSVITGGSGKEGSMPGLTAPKIDQAWLTAHPLQPTSRDILNGMGAGMDKIRQPEPSPITASGQGPAPGHVQVNITTPGQGLFAKATFSENASVGGFPSSGHQFGLGWRY